MGLLLAGVYIVPAAYEQAWVNIDQAVSAGFRPAENFLFTWILDPEHNLVNLEISAVAVLMITLTGIGAVVSHHRTRSSRFIWIAMFALAVISALLMFPVSGCVWQFAPKLRFVQFPWRWLLPLGVSLAFFLGETVATSRRRLAVALGCVALLAGTGVLIARATYWDSDDLEDILAAVSSGQGYEGTYEYCTRGGDQTDLPRAVALGCAVAGRAQPKRRRSTGSRSSRAVGRWRIGSPNERWLLWTRPARCARPCACSTIPRGGFA